MKKENLTAIISRNSSIILEEYLNSKGLKVERFGPIQSVDIPVSCHPDMIYCWLKDDTVFFGKTELLSKIYPGDIRYNGCSTGKYFIHNLKYTDEDLIKLVDELELIKINVKQGYAKCSTVVVDEDSIITYDKGIAEPCRKAGLDVLEISPEGVILEGYNCGFIGGASGRIGDEIVFNGNLKAHSDFKKIIDFINSKGLKVKYFEEFPLTDIGSIVSLK